ncbi:hypothetical protein PC128_g3840 [Phytophthora cactorum]|nr:hypothetical protein PC122_g3064 [Phytophthora cactorum]KAG3187261.1 hypothetical protein C6341_g3343 [Phytophthora cactorum]KAG3201510.1 hypothetical protein PC128_g3840 [Phytophthora cactorum]
MFRRTDPPELQVIHSSEKPTHWCGECSHKIASTQRAHKRKKTLMIQLIFLSCFLIAFVIYISVGMSLAPESKRLSVADCLRENLGTTYCTDTKRLDDTGTTLDDDRDAVAVSQMSAGGQIACILSLVGYSISFATNDYAEEDNSSARSAIEMHHSDEESLLRKFVEHCLEGFSPPSAKDEEP